MPKISMSTLSAQDFIEMQAALGLKQFELARSLGVARGTASRYGTGSLRIPTSVADQLVIMLAARTKHLETLTGKVVDSVTDMIVETNIIRQDQERAESRLHSSELTLANRLKPPDNRVFPAYRLSAAKAAVYRAALESWSIEVERRLKHVLGDANRIKMHRLEYDDLRALRESLSNHAPYEALITFTEWHTVARALRWHSKADSAAYAVYQHWRRHKGCGYPIALMRERAHASALQEAS